MTASIQKRYEYKVSRSGIFLGILQNVKSEFYYTQPLYSVGAQLSIIVSQSADTAATPVTPILDETGAIITDEIGNAITEERAPDVVGDSANNILIRNDNIIAVYEFSSHNVNGILVYTGYISNITPMYGGDDTIAIACLPLGQDLDHYLTPGGTLDALDQSQTQSDGDPSGDIGSWYTSTNFGDGQRYGQTFIVGAGVTNLSAIVVRLSINSGSRPITMKIYNSITEYTTGVGPRATITQNLTNTTVQDTTFRPSTALTVTPGQTVFFTLDPDPASTFADTNAWLGIAVKTSDVYSGGSLQRHLSSSSTYYAPFTYDMYFKTYSTINSTTKTYTNSDPSTTLANIMDYYISSGGGVSKPVAGYTATGVTPASTVFKLNSILEAIQKIDALAPYDWYWYVDTATNILYFKETATTAAHRMIKGRHIELLKLQMTKEQIINVVYFTGAQTAGVNLFTQVISASSLLTNRRGMARLSDNTVTDLTVAQLIAQNYINQHSSQTYTATITITDATYDISLFSLGDTVQFEGFGTFVDTLLLQIVGLTRNIDNVTLSLGVLPPRQTALAQQLALEVQAMQTIANPASPS